MADHGKGRNTSYSYDALNRLISAGEGSLDAMAQGDTVHTDYSYDNRGNMIREEQGGQLVHGYEYGAMNRLAKAWDDKGQEALYRYNGLGQRTGKTVNGRDEDYLLDLTKPYHNLLGISGEGNEQCFYFDWNVAAMEETGKGTTGSGRRALAGLHYYIQDELGSPLRVSGFGAEAGALSGRSSYLCYGYDEFGNDLGRELEGAGIPNPYDGQGEEQPFGYTGYRYDGISGTYFAQAREYKVESGRFVTEDPIMSGRNWYLYCNNNSIKFIDPHGLEYTLGEPQTPEQTFDEDFVYDPDAKATISDRMQYSDWWKAAMIAQVFLPEASKSYLHYWWGSGEPIYVDLDKALKEDSYYNQRFNEMLTEAQEYAEKLHDTDDSFSMTGTLYEFTNGTSQNWQKTLGAFWGWGSADVIYEDGKYTMIYTLHVKDRYNFNKGQGDIATGIPDAVNGRFAVLGWAKSFFTYGETTKVITWYEGEIDNRTIEGDDECDRR